MNDEGMNRQGETDCLFSSFLFLFFAEIFSLTQKSEICEKETTTPLLSGEKE